MYRHGMDGATLGGGGPQHATLDLAQEATDTPQAGAGCPLPLRVPYGDTTRNPAYIVTRYISPHTVSGSRSGP
jgi:hypothetical protein